MKRFIKDFAICMEAMLGLTWKWWAIETVISVVWTWLVYRYDTITYLWYSNSTLRFWSWWSIAVSLLYLVTGYWVAKTKMKDENPSGWLFF